MRKLLFLLVLLALPGCVVFESQTIVWRHDAVRDELRMLMIFEGIFSEGRGETQRDTEALRSVLLRPRTFFFSNWILEYDRDMWLETLLDIRDRKEALSPELYAIEEQFFELVLANMLVENGTFYLNDDGKLAGYQQVTLNRVSEIFVAANELLNLALIEGELDADELAMGSASEIMIRDAAHAGHEWLVLDGGELRLQLPVARDDYEEFVVEGVNDDEWQALSGAGLRQTYVNGVVAFALGRPWIAKTTMSVNVENGPYQPNLVEFVEAQGRLEAQPDFDAIVRRFIGRE